MRLNEFEKGIIKNTAKEIFGEDTEIFIFGSRVDDTLKGGDIDIYLKCLNKENLLDKKIKYLIKLEKLLGEQKIDVIINHPKAIVKPIFKIAESTGIRL
ncbi:MAG: nucleotidyltransferase domain-containing protein [Ignavibacteriales bacterium]|nr:nucleotidyltransferase domain-containing protein [Ignavibacteriales bacterium]